MGNTFEALFSEQKRTAMTEKEVYDQWPLPFWREVREVFGSNESSIADPSIFFCRRRGLTLIFSLDKDVKGPSSFNTPFIIHDPTMRLKRKAKEAALTKICTPRRSRRLAATRKTASAKSKPLATSSTPTTVDLSIFFSDSSSLDVLNDDLTYLRQNLDDLTCIPSTILCNLTRSQRYLTKQDNNDDEELGIGLLTTDEAEGFVEDKDHEEEESAKLSLYTSGLLRVPLASLSNYDSEDELDPHFPANLPLAMDLLQGRNEEREMVLKSLETVTCYAKLAAPNHLLNEWLEPLPKYMVEQDIFSIFNVLMKWTLPTWKNDTKLMVTWAKAMHELILRAKDLNQVDVLQEIVQEESLDVVVKLMDLLKIQHGKEEAIDVFAYGLEIIYNLLQHAGAEASSRIVTAQSDSDFVAFLLDQCLEEPHVRDEETFLATCKIFILTDLSKLDPTLKRSMNTSNAIPELSKIWKKLHRNKPFFMNDAFKAAEAAISSSD